MQSQHSQSRVLMAEILGEVNVGQLKDRYGGMETMRATSHFAIRLIQCLYDVLIPCRKNADAP